MYRAKGGPYMIFHNPMAGLSPSNPVRLPTPLPSDRLQGALHQIQDARGRRVVDAAGLVTVAVTWFGRHVIAGDLAQAQAGSGPGVQDG